mmetsp:Transcript_18889/g.32257  ORF Transcript_18889/g.32257 Transcript_18889/m.32257 type:complete len:157 (-) Transcript_18889:292-762(-)
MLCSVNSDTIKTNISDDNLLQVSFKVDTKTNCNVRVSVCVTEQKNDLNVPTMFYTPKREGYVHTLNLMKGLGQEIMFGEVDFDMKLLKNQELVKHDDKYFPMIISINYNKNGQNFAYISYCVFVKDSMSKITGARSIKQIVLINGLPYQIKSIYGL